MFSSLTVIKAIEDSYFLSFGETYGHKKRSSQKTYIKMRFPIISRCIQTKVEDNYRIKITFHHSFQRLKGSVKRLKQICNFCLIRDAVNRFFSLKKSIRVRKQ